MARLQILVLPTTTVGDTHQSSYLLVLDQVSNEQAKHLTPPSRESLNMWGAQGLLVFNSKVDVIQTYEHISPDD